MNIRTLLMALTLSAAAAGYGQTSTLNLMPVPRNVTLDTGVMTLDNGFAILFEKGVEPRLERAAARVIDRISRETGITFIPRTDQPHPRVLTVLCESPRDPRRTAVEDESYKLAVTPGGARLTAPRRTAFSAASKHSGSSSKPDPTAFTCHVYASRMAHVSPGEAC